MEDFDKKVASENIAGYLQELRDSFSPRSDAFFAIMAKKIIEKGYNLRRLKRGVEKVIMTCAYHELSISIVITTCDKESPSRMVEYERLTSGRRWETVILPESAYDSDVSMYTGAGEKPKFIRFID